MSSLAKFYRFVVQNETGATVATSDLEVIRKKFSGGGNIYKSDDPLEILGDGGDTISTGTQGDGATQTNTDGWLGLDGRFYVTISAGSPAGSVMLMYQVSEDGTDWPDDDTGHTLIAIPFSATGTKIRHLVW